MMYVLPVGPCALDKEKAVLLLWSRDLPEPLLVGQNLHRAIVERYGAEFVHQLRLVVQ